MTNNINPGNAQQQRDFNDAINDYRSLLREISNELGRHRSHVADANAEYRKLDSIARQIQNTEEGINGLTSEQLDKLRQKYVLSVREIEAQAQQLLRQRGITNLTQTQLNYLIARNRLSEKESALLQGHLDSYQLELSFVDRINDKLEQRVQYEEEIKELTGATGAILDSMNGTMRELGMGALSQYLEIDKAKKAMQEEADAIARGEREGGKLQVRMAGLKVLAEGFTKALFSAEAIIGFVVGELTKGSQNMADFRKQTGMSYESAYKLNMEMKGIAAASGDNFITSEKLNKSFAMLTQQLGVSADILGGEALISATNLEQRLGMSAEQASKLTVFSRLQGKNTEDILASSYDVVGAFNMQNKTALNVNAVMDSVASASTATYLTMGKNVTALTKAATAAKALGLNMQQVEQISESMLNFEDSIGKELEAQLLTGGHINLAKAREYALTGDMEGLASEIGKQEGILNAFKTKNVIAQKAAADALGITREQLADMTMQQELNVLGAENFKKTYGETAYESVKARSASEKFADAIEKVKDILGSILQAFSPILDILASILNFPLVPYFLAGLVVIKAFGLSVMGVGKAFGSMYSMGKQALLGIAQFAKAPLQGLKAIGSKLTGGFKQGATGMGASSPWSPGQQTPGGDKSKGMLDGIGKLPMNKILKGAGAILILSAAIFVAAKAFQQFSEVTWESVAKGTVALVGLAGVAFVLGKIKGPILEGAFAIAILGAALIPLAFALNLAAPGIQAFGTVITSVFSGLAELITAVADGFVKILGAVTMDNIMPMLLLGPALFSIAAGLMAVGAAGLVALPGLAALAVVSKIAPSIVSTSEKTAGAARGTAEESQLEKRIDELVTAINKGHIININIDGAKIATVTQTYGKQTGTATS